MKNKYAPEGSLISTPENRELTSSRESLDRAAVQGRTLEGVAQLCDGSMRLHIDLYGIRGIIERSEAAYDPSGQPIKDIAIITRVGKPVCFKVLGRDFDSKGEFYRLSRRDAQQECYRNYLRDLCPGDVIDAKVTHLETFGAFVDIGCGLPSLLSIDSISVSRISHPRDRLSCGMSIRCVVRSIDRTSHKILVSMRELLGSWEENASAFEAGQTVAGIVRSVESYGVFVELAPNLAGLAELREGDPPPRPGQRVAVYIKSILPERMKIKLVLVDAGENDAPTPATIKYFVDPKVSHIDRWVYSPKSSPRVIDTVFDDTI